MEWTSSISLWLETSPSTESGRYFREAASTSMYTPTRAFSGALEIFTLNSGRELKRAASPDAPPYIEDHNDAHMMSEKNCGSSSNETPGTSMNALSSAANASARFVKNVLSNLRNEIRLEAKTAFSIPSCTSATDAIPPCSGGGAFGGGFCGGAAAGGVAGGVEGGLEGGVGGLGGADACALACALLRAPAGRSRITNTKRAAIGLPRK